MLSTIFRRDINTVRLALKSFELYGMIEIIDNVITIPNWSKHQNLDQLEERKEYMKEYMRKYRGKQKDLIECKDNGKSNSKANVNPLDIEEELEEERDKKKDKEHIVQDAHALFEELWSLYPSRKGKGQVSEAKQKKLVAIGRDEMVRAIERYKADLKKDSKWRKPQNGSTFFNTGYVDYLDKNYAKEGDANGPSGGRTGTNEKGLVAEAIEAGVSTDFDGFGGFD